MAQSTVPTLDDPIHWDKEIAEFDAGSSSFAAIDRLEASIDERPA